VLELTLIVTPAPEPEPTSIPEAAPSQPVVQIPSQLAPQLPDSIETPVEAPRVIAPEVIEEILEFIESEEPLAMEQEASGQNSTPTPTQLAEATTTQIGSKPAENLSGLEPVDVEDKAEQRKQEEDLTDSMTSPIQGALAAELVSTTQQPEEPGFILQLVPWLIGGTVASALAFVAYRKMMVR
jgi:hypothetical protein